MSAAAPVANDDRKDTHRARRRSVCGYSTSSSTCSAPSRLDDLSTSERTLERCVEAAGATLLHIHLHRLRRRAASQGWRCWQRATSSIHSWPEAGYAALDVFMCGDADPNLAVPVLKEAFEADDVQVKEHRRGEELEPLKWQAAARQPVSFQAAKAVASANAGRPDRKGHPSRQPNKSRAVRYPGGALSFWWSGEGLLHRFCEFAPRASKKLRTRAPHPQRLVLELDAFAARLVGKLVQVLVPYHVDVLGGGRRRQRPDQPSSAP